jgi:MinD-like ATPase involved in chromosome partitioning or flagellar assembly
VGKIISVHSFRGGTGKSNLTANLVAAVARRGKRVGVVDTDIQSPGIHVLFGQSDEKPAHTLNDYLWGKCAIEQTAIDVTSAVRTGPGDSAVLPGVFLIPSSLNSGDIARVLREGYDVALLNDGFRALLKGLNLDYLFIDTHPGVNEETLLSIAISDTLIVILRPDKQDFLGTAVTVELARRLEVPEMFLVINKIPPGLAHAAVVAQAEPLFAAPVLGAFSLNAELSLLGSSGIFCLRSPHHAFSQEINRIAAHLAR